MSTLPETVSPAELAEVLGLAPSSVARLTRDKAVPKVARGRYDLRAAVQAYVAYARENPVGRKIADPTLAEEKRRLAKEQADKIALDNARKRGDLLDAAEVARRWVDYTASLRAALLAVPPRVAAHLGLDRRTAADLDAELRAALDQIATEGERNPVAVPENPVAGSQNGESPKSGVTLPEIESPTQRAATALCGADPEIEEMLS